MRPELIRFGREVCGDLQQAERREWWLANGLGGYASGTVAGTLTRRYHGLLVAPLDPPLGRFLVFVKADACLELDGESRPLFCNRWPNGVIDPDGNRHLECFRLEGRMPVWRFAFGDLRLELRIWLEPGANTVYLAYRPVYPAHRQHRMKLFIRLLVNGRDHHHNAEPEAFKPVLETDGAGRLTVLNSYESGSQPYRLHFQMPGGTITAEHVWHRNFDLPIEQERGLPSRDHHLCIGEGELALSNNRWSGLVASLEKQASPAIEEAMQRFFAHDAAVLIRARRISTDPGERPAWIEQLTLAADSFLFARRLDDGSEGESVIAGYPWFGDWGRDTMIALPGLTLATGRYESARRILETFARFVDRGMLPNALPDSGVPSGYNTVDAALWYFEAWRAYVEATGDRESLSSVMPALEDIIRWHVHGTRYGIALDRRDGLLAAGEAGVQLTWMDAKVGDWVVTPRIGKPVEINALWYNALETMAQFARLLRRPADAYERRAEAARSGFQRFLMPAGEGLFDVLDGPDGDDDSLRPNQILAVSLPFSPLAADAQRRVVDVCGKTLLTSYGLRSLAESHPRYAGRYRGDVKERDGAYHQGTVWGWLLGHYALAEYRVTGDAGLALSRLEPVRDHLFDAGLGTVGELFDAIPPHTPRGAPAQAWSVACTLDAWWRLQSEKPKS